VIADIRQGKEGLIVGLASEAEVATVDALLRGRERRACKPSENEAYILPAVELTRRRVNPFIEVLQEVLGIVRIAVVQDDGRRSTATRQRVAATARASGR
jgi:hypothetical protein